MRAVGIGKNFPLSVRLTKLSFNDLKSLWAERLKIEFLFACQLIGGGEELS